MSATVIADDTPFAGAPPEPPGSGVNALQIVTSAEDWRDKGLCWRHRVEIQDAGLPADPAGCR